MGGFKLPLLRSMTLTVTERCNLRCAYCYVPVTRGRTMSPEIADASVDLFARRAARTGTVTLSFFGGEPFLAQQTMRRAAERAKPLAKGKRQLRLIATTNGLAFDARALDFCRESGMEIAVSVDGDESVCERPYAGGRPSAPSLMAKLPAILSLDPQANLIARMTVTPDNVGSLARGVRVLAGLGFRRIFWLPAYEMEWSDDAVSAYGREHRAVGAWLAEQRSTGGQVPELLAWRGIAQRLASGRGKGVCGAGVTSVAVATDGRLLACYRLASEPEGRAHELGHVTRGFKNKDALALFASIEPGGLQPEDGDCASCAASDGCTHFCPALGIATRHDARAVPASVCRLMRSAVEGVRGALAATKRSAACGAASRAPSRTAPRWAAVAMVAATSSVACGSIAGGLCADAGAPGLCAVQVDAAADVHEGGVFGGLCNVQDAQPDVQADADDAQPQDDAMGGGLCPPLPGIC